MVSRVKDEVRLKGTTNGNVTGKQKLLSILRNMNVKPNLPETSPSPEISKDSTVRAEIEMIKATYCVLRRTLSTQ